MAKLDSQELHTLTLKCLDFYIEAGRQILLRFPIHNNPLEHLDILNPERVKQGGIGSIVIIVSQFKQLTIDSDFRMIDEWRLLRNSEHPETNNIVEFWTEIENKKLGDGSFAFQTLSSFVFNIYTLPRSSASAERVFSAVNLMKTKQRNALATKTIAALLHGNRLIDKNKCCFQFKPEAELRNLMSNTMYLSESNSD